MKKVMIALALLVAVVVIGSVSAAQLIKAQGGYAKPVTTPVCSTNAAELLGYINAERAKLGAPTLVVDSKLALSSQNKLQDMVNGHYYGHRLLDGSEQWGFIRSQGVHAALGEDLDVNGISPSIAWTTFKNSPAHYQSLTNAIFTRIGISSECVTYPIEHSTGPDDNTNLVGTTAKELTVIHLASPEPTVAPTQQSAPATNSRTICTYYPAVETVPATSICN